MGINVETFFVQTDDRATLIKYLAQRLTSPPDISGRQPDWGLQRSYDIVIASDPKRKIAVSPVQDGWIAAVESKETLDYTLLETISREMRTRVIVCILYEVTGSCGYACCNNGVLEETYYSEEDKDPFGMVTVYLKKRSVPYGLMMFRHAVENRWEIIRKGQSIT